MKPEYLILIAGVAVALLRAKQKVIVTSDGTYRVIRRRGTIEGSGGRDAELWAKDGVDPRERVFVQDIADPTFFYSVGGFSA